MSREICHKPVSKKWWCCGFWTLLCRMMWIRWDCNIVILPTVANGIYDVWMGFMEVQSWSMIRIQFFMGLQLKLHGYMIYHQSKSWGPKSVWFPLVELSSQGVLELWDYIITARCKINTHNVLRIPRAAPVHGKMKQQDMGMHVTEIIPKWHWWIVNSD